MLHEKAVNNSKSSTYMYIIRTNRTVMTKQAISRGFTVLSKKVNRT